MSIKRRAQTFAERVCEKCGGTYTPTGATQKFCTVCGVAARAAYFSRQTTPQRQGLARDPWVREQESIKCRRCGAEPGRQCVTASATFAQLPHLERYLDAGGVPGERSYPGSGSRYRQQVFDHYGWTCACCDTAERLTIDHVNGGGTEHRKEIGLKNDAGGDKFYRWLVKNNFPEGFQTLCGPCNSSKFDGEHCRMHVTVCPTCHRPFEDGVQPTLKVTAGQRRRKITV